MKCAHCQQNFEKSALKHAKDGDLDVFFCCGGCENVYFLLKNQDLSDFYELLGDAKLSPVDPKRAQNTDFETTHADFIIKENGEKSASFVLFGVHCAACLWLIEKILIKQENVKNLHINHTNNRLKLTYRGKLAPILQKIQDLGYDAAIYDPKQSEILHAREQKRQLTALITGIFFTMNIMWIAVAQYLGLFLGMDEHFKIALNIAGFLLATPVLFYTGAFFYVPGSYKGN